MTLGAVAQLITGVVVPHETLKPGVMSRPASSGVELAAALALAFLAHRTPTFRDPRVRRELSEGLAEDLMSKRWVSWTCGGGTLKRTNRMS